MAELTPAERSVLMEKYYTGKMSLDDVITWVRKIAGKESVIHAECVILLVDEIDRLRSLRV